MIKISDDIVLKLIAICDEALKNYDMLHQFYEMWPREANEVKLFRNIFEDIENHLVHYPYFPDEYSVMLDKILLDILLENKYAMDEIDKCRKHYLKNPDKVLIKELICDYLVGISD